MESSGQLAAIQADIAAKQSVIAATQEQIRRLEEQKDAAASEASKQLTSQHQQICLLKKDLEAETEKCKQITMERAAELLSTFPDCETMSTFSTSDSRAARMVRRLLRRPLSETSRPPCVEMLRDESKPIHHVLSKIFIDSLTQHRKDRRSSTWCDPPKLEITRIYETINPNLLSQYKTTRKRLAEERPDGCTALSGIPAIHRCNVEDGHVDLNECVLFHGCPLEAVEKILEKELDPQRGGEGAGAMFGIGSYFAENASKSDFYATCPEPGRQAERCIMAVRVMLGNTKVVTTEDCESWSRAPDGFDSVTAEKRGNGGQVDHREFVVYKEQMALVRWLIYYRHKSECECHNCKYRGP